MSKDAFCHLHDIIAGDPIFVSTGPQNQWPIRIQLATFLIRYGAQTYVKTASVVSIAEGTVDLYCKCVWQAIRNVNHSHLAWPEPPQQAYLKEEMARWGFPGCIGMVDGSLIRLMDKPKKNGWAYYSRKKFYVVSFYYLW